jgi:hypothetical protein
VSVDPWNLDRIGPVLRVTVSNKAGTSDLEALLKAVLIEVRGGARDIVLTRLGMERPSTAAASFVRLLLRHRKDLGISVSVNPPLDVSTT